MKLYNTFAPLFPGFYSTVFEYGGESEDIQYYFKETGKDLEYDDFNWNYSDYMERVSKAFVSRLETELKHFLPVNLTFQSIYSPREYNFGNDVIYIGAELDLNELIKLIEARKDEAAKYFSEKYTSCSGFISSHSNKLEDWLKPEYIEEEPEHRIGALLDCLCSIELESEDIMYWTDSEYWIDFAPKEETEAN